MPPGNCFSRKNALIILINQYFLNIEGRREMKLVATTAVSPLVSTIKSA